MYDVRYIPPAIRFVRAPGVTEVMNPAPIFRYLFAEQAADPAQARLATPAWRADGFWRADFRLVRPGEGRDRISRRSSRPNIWGIFLWPIRKRA